MFWQFRIILPIVLALAAWFMGEFSGHYVGRWLGPRRPPHRCGSQNEKHVGSRCIALALAAVLVAATAGLSPARADLHLMNRPRPPSGSAASSPIATLTVPAGTHIRAVLPSGKTQTIKGPYNGTVADLAKGQPLNEGVMAWIKNFLRTGGATEATPGATRSIGRQPPESRASASPGPPFR